MCLFFTVTLPQVYRPQPFSTMLHPSPRTDRESFRVVWCVSARYVHAASGIPNDLEKAPPTSSSLPIIASEQSKYFSLFARKTSRACMYTTGMNETNERTRCWLEGFYFPFSTVVGVHDECMRPDREKQQEERTPTGVVQDKSES